VHVVTADEAVAGTYSISDVVLPLPGARVQYPAHEAGWPLYCRLAAADGIALPGASSDEYAAAVQAAAAAAAGGEPGTAAPADTVAAPADGQQPAAAAAAAEDGTPAAAVFMPKRHRVREFQLGAMTGDYRKLLHFPQLSHRYETAGVLPGCHTHGSSPSAALTCALRRFVVQGGALQRP
jgi:hypothetical protein